MSARRGAQFVLSWKTDYELENISRENHKNVVYKKRKHFDDVIFRVLAFG